MAADKGAKMNRRKFMQLCGATVGGGVLGVGKGAVMTEQAAGMSTINIRIIGRTRGFTRSMNTVHWSIKRLCDQGIAQSARRDIAVAAYDCGGRSQ